MAEPSAAARALKALREEAGLSLRQIADELGVSLTSYQHYEDRFRKAYLPMDLARRVAAVLAQHGIPPSAVLALAGTTPEAANIVPVTPPQARTAPGSGRRARIVRFDRTDRLPVYGSAQAGPDGQRLEFDPIEWIDRPETLRDVPGAFAMYVMNDSMEPKYEQGDMLYVHPTRVPRRMSHVVIVKKDGTALVKRLVRAEAEAFVVRQYNPPREYEIPRQEVTALYLVLGSMDGR